MFLPFFNGTVQVAPSRLLERDESKGVWRVGGQNGAQFYDTNHQGKQGAFLEAMHYASITRHNSKRKFAITRNVKFVAILSKRIKQERLYARITRPMGGYKYFQLKDSGRYSDGSFIYDLEAFEQVVELANLWFIKERASCEESIMLKNIGLSVKKREERSRRLFTSDLID